MFLSSVKSSRPFPNPQTSISVRVLSAKKPPGRDMPPLVLQAGYRAELRYLGCGASTPVSLT
jgi:hypothetical protein